MKNFNKKNGFTIVETLVAIGILSVSILAGFTAVQNGLKSSNTAKNQITAFYLVQEGMEYIKNKRDDNALDFINGGTSTWLTGLNTCTGSGTCQVDPPQGTVSACTGGPATCNVLVLTTATGLYGYGAGTQTSFRRGIQIRPGTLADEVFVTITISWLQGNTTKSFQVTQSVFNRLQ